MLFDVQPEKRRPRSIGFVASAVVHIAVLALLLLIAPSRSSFPADSTLPHKYYVRFLDLSLPKRGGHSGSGANGASGTPGLAGLSGLRLPKAKPGVQWTPAEAARDEGARNVGAARRRRPFELAPAAQTPGVKETLVQPDVVKNVTIPENIPIPAAIMWTQAQPPPFPTRQFVAPPLKEIPKIAVSVPTPPTLKSPNGATAVSEIMVAPALTSQVAHLPAAPAMSSPVVLTGPQQARQMPQTVLPKSKDDNVISLLSIPDSSMVAKNLALVPPANQITLPEQAGVPDPAARDEDGGGGGQPGAGTNKDAGGSGGGSQGKGSGENGSGGAGSGNRSGGAGGSGSGVGDGGSGGSGKGLGQGFGRGSGAGSGYGSGSGGNGAGELNWAAGKAITRLNLPKEGKYNVVVLGSDAPALNADTAAQLSGRIIYTVYVDVRLRKKWILEYCLPKDAQQKVAVKGRATPVDPPWPFFLVRPDRFNASDFDYVMLHAKITDEGHFDQLALVYPGDLPERDLLIQALQQWVFRPANRDGEPIGVEVLLIIPGQPD